MPGVAAVTGAEGFIGSHLVELLVQQGHRVRAMVLYNSFGSWGWLDTLDDDLMAHVDVVLGDVRDLASTRQLMQGADVVYHLAALNAIPYSYQAPRSFLETNLVGTLNVLEAVRELETPRLIHTSTSETYGTARAVPIDEDHPNQAQSPYAASKAGADKLVESFHRSFGVPAVILRPFNTFGPRQSARGVIATITVQLAAGAKVLKLGSLAPTRDFTFVKDTATAFLAVGTAPAADVIGEQLNAGSGNEISIGQLAVDIAWLMGRKVTVVEDPARVRPKESEVMRLVCDSTKLRQRTGWKPAYTFEEGLRETVDWFTDEANMRYYKRPDLYHV